MTEKTIPSGLKLDFSGAPTVAQFFRSDAFVRGLMEAHQPVPIDFFGQSSLNIGDMALYDKVRQVLFRLKEQDDRWVRAQ